MRSHEGPLAPAKMDLLRVYFDLVERQVQFGDTKASLLIAANSVLLAINGAAIKLVSGCRNEILTLDCTSRSPAFWLATIAGLLVIVGLACALWAARPAKVHDNPPARFFLLSHVGRLAPQKFVDCFREMSAERVVTEALLTIQGKSAYALGKFQWLRWGVLSTLLSLLFLSSAIACAVVTQPHDKGEVHVTKERPKA